MGTNGNASIFTELDDFDMVGFFAKLIVMGRGRCKDWRFTVWHEANVTTVAFEHILIFKGEFPSFARVGVFGIIRNAERNFASWKTREIILNRLIDELGGFDGAADTIEGDGASCDEGELRSDLFYLATRKNRLELGEGNFWLTT